MRCAPIASAAAPTCQRRLPAFICSFECTFCPACAEALDDRCPNCGGELVDRPTRAKALHAAHPPSAERKFAG